MDIKYPLLVAGLGANKVLILEMNKMEQIPNRIINNQYYIESLLSSNISCVAIFQDLTGYCVGTYDGRANLSKLTRDNNNNIKNGDSIICFKSQKYDNPYPNS